MNYPEADVNWTRISEYKHSPNQPAGVREYPGTVVYREYSTDDGDPYYPVPNKRNKDLYLKYQVVTTNNNKCPANSDNIRPWQRQRRGSSLLAGLLATSTSTWTKQFLMLWSSLTLK